MTAFEAVCGGVWAIQEEVLHTILEIAARENPSVEAVMAQIGRPLENTRAVSMRDGTAVIPITGPIFRRANLFTEVSGCTSVQHLATDLGAALANDKVTSILLDIDSPGGEVTGIAELASQIQAAAGKKPIVAYVSGIGASAAYWLASAAPEVVLASTAVVGSIGVYAAYPNGKRPGSTEFVSSQSPNKRPNPETERGAAEIQKTVDATAAVFVADVARYRRTTQEKVLEDFGKGGLLVGKAAVKAGMADRIGTLEDVLAEFASRAAEDPAPTTAADPRGTTGESMSDTERKPSLWSQFVAALGGNEDGIPPAPPAAAAPAAPDPEVARLKSELERINKERAEERKQAHLREAAAFADAEIAASRAVPAERAEIAAAYFQAAQDDAAAPAVVTFADGKTGTRVEGLQRLHAARPAHGYTQELVGDPSLVALFNRETTEEADPDAELVKSIGAFAERMNGASRKGGGT
jgi:ClpP class serine protease